MADYKVGTGWNVGLVSLLKVTPEPMGDPVAPTERNYGASGAVYDQGKFVRWHWDHVDSPEEYYDLLEYFNLHGSLNADVTIYTRNERLEWKRYNGIAQMPEPTVDMKWNNFFLRDIDIYITDLVELA